MRTLRTPITEADWQTQVIELAKLLGYEHMHVRRSIGKGRRWTTATNVPGWPDLTLWSTRHRRLLFVELKTDTGVVSPAQMDVIRSLRDAGQEAYVWRPSDMDAIAKRLGDGRASR